MWAADLADPNTKGGLKQRRKFPSKVMVWLGGRSKGVMSLVILNEGTVDHNVYIERVLPIALKNENEAFGSDWILQQGWCSASFASFDTTMVSRQLFIIY